MVDGNLPEWLPPGFVEKTKYSCGRKTKYYCNLATCTKYYSKRDVLFCTGRENVCRDTPQAISIKDNKLSDDKTSSIKRKTTDSSEWLPHGWTVEERTRKSGSLMGKTYMVYTEPSTGRKFYSKPTITKYLETINHTGNTAKQIKSSSQVKATHSEHPATRRQVFLGWESGKESCDRNSSETHDFESLVQDNFVERKIDIEKTFEDIKPDIRVTTDKIAVSIGSDNLIEQKFLGNEIEKQIQKGLIDSTKSEKKGTPSFPHPTSKRLVDYEPEYLPKSVLSTQSSHGSAGANGFPWHLETKLAQEVTFNVSIREELVQDYDEMRLAQNLAIPDIQKSQEASVRNIDEANKFPQEPDNETVQEVANQLSIGKELVLVSDPSNTISVQIDPSGSLTIPDVQTGWEVTEQKVESTKSQDSKVGFPFGDFWSDPCLEFAFKTLTGEIPVEDAVAFQAYSPVVDASSNSESCNMYQSNRLVNPPFPTLENISFPSCSDISSQQPSRDSGNKERKAKV